MRRRIPQAQRRSPHRLSKGTNVQQPLTPRDFATFERIALTPRQRPLALDPYLRVATPRTRKARRIGLVLQTACKSVMRQTRASRSLTDHTDERRTGTPRPSAARLAWSESCNRIGNDGEGEGC
jgi:hypothetical protein